MAKCKKMSNFTTVMIAEGVDQASRAQQICAWQQLIDSGMVWTLQGWFGRTATELIRQGICHEARKGR